MESKNKWRKKRQRTRRELTGDWPDDKIRELIYNVQIRPELWDICSINYRSPKPQSWQEVALQLGKGYDWSDCRLKWQNLRVTYKCNINKIAKKQSDGTDEAPRILWRFFHSMRFISKNSSDYTSNFNASDSNINFDTEMTTASCSTLASQQNFDFSQCSTSIVKQESLRTMDTPTPTPPPLPAASTFIKTKPSQQNLPLKLMKNKNDEHACFGNFIASELRNLPPEHSFALKRRLNRTLLEYWDEIEPLAQPRTQTAAVTKTEAFENILS